MTERVWKSLLLIAVLGRRRATPLARGDACAGLGGGRRHSAARRLFPCPLAAGDCRDARRHRLCGQRRIPECLFCGRPDPSTEETGCGAAACRAGAAANALARLLRRVLTLQNTRNFPSQWRRWAFAVCLLGLFVPSQARPVRMWGPDELAQKADLIVIATAQSTADEFRFDTPRAKPDTWIPVISVFDVQSVLKGSVVGKTVVVRHYRYFSPSADITVVDGPAFVTFNPQLKNPYLIYLKRVNGAYEPLSGQEDPCLSFSLLQPYQWSQEQPHKSPAAKGRVNLLRGAGN